MVSFEEYKARVYSEEKRRIDPLFGRWYRFLSLPLSRVICQTCITPNQITLLQIVVGFIAAVLIGITSETRLFLVAVFLLHLSYLLDCVDGELARFQGKQSVGGVFFDKYGHAFLMQATFIAVGVFFARKVDSPLFVVFIFMLSWGASFASFMPAYRLVITVVEALIFKKSLYQYDVDRYTSKGLSSQTRDKSKFRLDKNIDSLISMLSDSSQKNTFWVGIVSETFRHATYILVLSFISIMLLFEGFNEYALFVWLGLCFGLVFKEISIIISVMNRNVIEKKLWMYKIKFKDAHEANHGDK